MRRLRVIHVIATLTAGGAERQVELIAGESRHDVQVVALFRAGVVEQALLARGVPVHILGGMDGARRLTAIPRLARLLRAQRPDIVHVHLLSGQLWGIPAARLARVAVVVSTEHSIMQDTIENRPKTEALRRLYLSLHRLTTCTIAVSPATAERLREWGVPGTQDMPVINPPIDFAALQVDPAARAEVRAEFGIPLDADVIGAVGRLEPVKRLDRLLRAVAPLLRNGEAHLVIVGDGPEEATLTALARELNVAAAVHLTGPRGDVARLLSAMDVFISPSRDETFGMAIVEAAGAGLPVGYAQCPALDGLDLPASRFRTVSPTAQGDEELAALAAAVSELLASGRAAVPEVLQARYGATQTAARIDDLYEQLTAQAAQRQRRWPAPSGRRRRSSDTARP